MPMELHAVHYKSTYETQEAAFRENGGVVILVYLFQVSKKINIYFGKKLILLYNISKSPFSLLFFFCF